MGYGPAGLNLKAQLPLRSFLGPICQTPLFIGYPSCPGSGPRTDHRTFVIDRGRWPWTTLPNEAPSRRPGPLIRAVTPSWGSMEILWVSYQVPYHAALFSSKSLEHVSPGWGPTLDVRTYPFGREDWHASSAWPRRSVQHQFHMLLVSGQVQFWPHRSQQRLSLLLIFLVATYSTDST